MAISSVPLPGVWDPLVPQTFHRNSSNVVSPHARQTVSSESLSPMRTTWGSPQWGQCSRRSLLELNLNSGDLSPKFLDTNLSPIKGLGDRSPIKDLGPAPDGTNRGDRSPIKDLGPAPDGTNRGDRRGQALDTNLRGIKDLGDRRGQA